MRAEVLRLWSTVTAPRRFGLVILPLVFFASGVILGIATLLGWIDASTRTQSDAAPTSSSWMLGVGAGIAIAITVPLIVALASRERLRGADLTYWAVGLLWYLFASIAVPLVPTGVTAALQGESGIARPSTLLLLGACFLLVALTLNRALYELRTTPDPPPEAVAFVAATHTLLALSALVYLISVLEGRFGMLLTEVALAGATGLSVLGVPASIVTLVAIGRHRQTAVGTRGVDRDVAASSTKAMSETPPSRGWMVAAAALVLIVAVRRR